MRRESIVRRAALAGLVALAISTVAEAGPRPGRTLGDFPDPFVIRGAEAWLAFSTNTGGVHLPCSRSTDLADWSFVGDAMPRLARWVTPGHTWAPSVLRRRGRWLLYYTARDSRTDLQAIGCAVAERPEGPYVDESARPLIDAAEEGGAIDASPFVDRDGRAYLLWKSDGNSQGKPTRLMIRPLSPDGRSLAGRATALLTRDREWEEPLVEAPSLVFAAGQYHLLYSANWWESDRYGVGHAVAHRLTGPYTKTTLGGPAFGSHESLAGPGGQEIFAGPGGLHLCFHAWTPGQVGYAEGGARRLHVTTLRFVDGRPVFGRVTPARSAGGR